jgi:hypothetical protein
MRLGGFKFHPYFLLLLFLQKLLFFLSLPPPHHTRLLCFFFLSPVPLIFFFSTKTTLTPLSFTCVHLRFRPSVFLSAIPFAISFSSAITGPLPDRRHYTAGDQRAKARPIATRDPSHVARGFAL